MRRRQEASPGIGSQLDLEPRSRFGKRPDTASLAIKVRLCEGRTEEEGIAEAGEGIARLSHCRDRIWSNGLSLEKSG